MSALLNSSIFVVDQGAEVLASTNLDENDKMILKGTANMPTYDLALLDGDSVNWNQLAVNTPPQGDSRVIWRPTN